MSGLPALAMQPARTSLAKQLKQVTFDQLGWVITANIEDESDEREGEADVSDWKRLFLQERGIGDFKSLFCLWFLSQTALTEPTRILARMQIEQIEKHFIAEWGTGAALRRIAAEIAVENPEASELLTWIPWLGSFWEGFVLCKAHRMSWLRRISFRPF